MRGELIMETIKKINVIQRSKIRSLIFALVYRAKNRFNQSRFFVLPKGFNQHNELERGIYLKRSIIIIISIVSSFTSLQAQTPLQVYQDTAALNNPSIKSLYKQYEMVKQRAPQIGALPDLQFGFGYFISPVETRVGPQQATIGLSQSFPWFGQLDAQQKAIIERAKAVLEQFNSERSSVNFEVASTYNSMYVLRKSIVITEENIGLLQTMKELATIKFESGKASMVDVLRVEMELGALENQLAYLKDSEQPLKSKFEQLLNTKLEGEITFPAVLWSEVLPASKELLKDSVVISSPSILSLEHELLSYDQELIAAKKTGAPSFTIGLNYIVVGDRLDYAGNDNGRDAILPTIGVKLPLYRKKYTALIKEKEIAKEGINLRKENLSNVLKTSLANGFRDYDDAVRRVALYIKLKKYAQQALHLLMAEYTSAETNLYDVIEMDRTLLQYALELEKARADRNVSVAYVNFLMGK